MTLLCTLVGHDPAAERHRNQGLEFSHCHHCRCDLLRFAEDGAWTEVPRGFHVVWREFGREADARAVALRMADRAPVRRVPRAAPPPPPAPRRRTHALTGVVGTLARLGRLVAADEPPADTGGITPAGQYVIRLPEGPPRG